MCQVASISVDIRKRRWFGRYRRDGIERIQSCLQPAPAAHYVSSPWIATERVKAECLNGILSACLKGIESPVSILNWILRVLISKWWKVRKPFLPAHSRS
jgi:hypothetical protein